ncbi:G-type lectin S-receptor-like serine/threonine-protein kinase At4g03230 [Solanum tuberosum]|uniref:G-type lectin S-receptor-like serine/threonine-protein kinase At4g03230 n=1 Tax=Solanum tuberosum TaxID=4113 RepID=UPI00073A0DE4|nr:PREDICTED: G-type lectin S-receptor-like serine/threonine-protein kinase At4g03230 [Solanum tuberosum]
MNESYSGRYFLLYHFELNFKGHSQSDKSKGTQGAHISLWHKAEGEAKVLMKENSDEAIDVPYFHLETILAATDNFSNANKLRQGGFGPVYKGIFPGEKEIAVKTLSSQSGQGIDEFKNEVTLIAKLQHRNLVRLLGYCINATEQILLYEYMPNKSLDTFIFGELALLSSLFSKSYISYNDLILLTYQIFSWL